MSLKTGAGSHNRDVMVAKKNYLIHVGKIKNYGFLYHKRKGRTTTVIKSNDFNRSKVVKTQDWCRESKTLIDKLKHQSWKLIHVVLLSTIKYIYNSYLNGLFYINSPESLPLKYKFKTIPDRVEMRNFLSILKRGNITNEEIYKLFNITSKEIDFINNMFKR